MYVVGEKYLSLTNGNIYEFLFFDGIIGMILSILLQVITYFFIKDRSIVGYFSEIVLSNNDGETNLKTMICNFVNIKKEGILASIPLILANFFETWAIWLLIFNISVDHFASFYSILLFVNFIYKEHIGIIIVRILGFAVIIFSLLIYNEIIILRFFDLDKNTTIEINRRSIIDSVCDFGEDDDEICTKYDDNYLIMKEDIEGINDEKDKTF